MTAAPEAPYTPTGMSTSVIGSHAHPGWLDLAVAAAERGELGPADIREVQDDAVDMALRDQKDAGIDVVVEGEMRRVGFFTAEFYRLLTGVEALGSKRRLGPAGHDQQHRFKILEPIAAPEGLGTVEEFTYARARTSKPIKTTLPGPFTLSGRLSCGPGEVYADRIAAARAFVPILAAEFEALVDAGATYIQIDEPSPAIHPEASDEFAALFNDAAAGVVGRVHLAAHLCFGNFFGRPLSKRVYRPVLEQALAFNVGELVLEWANREMTELDVAADIAAAGRHLSAGVVDVKNYYIETADERRRAHRAGPGVRRAREPAHPGARLRLQPDRPLGHQAQAARTRAGSRPRPGPPRLITARPCRPGQMPHW